MSSHVDISGRVLRRDHADLKPAESPRDRTAGIASDAPSHLSLVRAGIAPEPVGPSTPVQRICRTIAVANQKGGVGKTTTAINLSAAMAQAGRRVLLIDMDPQANATSGVGYRAVAEGAPTTYDILTGDVSLAAAIQPSGVDNLDVLPASPELAGAEVELVDVDERERVLRKALETVAGNYDVILIDCPPSLGLLTINALVACDSVLIPLQCEYYALEGLGHLMDTVGRIQDGLNPALEIEGVVLTMFDGRLNLSVQVAEEARKHLGERVYQTMIPRNVRLSEAPSFGAPVTVYDPACVGAVSYFNLAREILVHE